MSSRRGRCRGPCPAPRTTGARWPRSLDAVGAGQVPAVSQPQWRADPLEDELGQCPAGDLFGEQPGDDEAHAGVLERLAGPVDQGALQYGRRRASRSGQSVHSDSSAGSPEVWVSRWRRSPAPLAVAKRGSQVAIGSSRPRTPSSTRVSSTVLVNSLVIEARSKIADSVTGRRSAGGAGVPSASA